MTKEGRLAEWVEWQRIRHYRGELSEDKVDAMLDLMGEAFPLTDSEVRDMDGVDGIRFLSEDTAIGWDEEGFPIAMIDRITKHCVVDNEYTLEEALPYIEATLAAR